MNASKAASNILSSVMGSSNITASFDAELKVLYENVIPTKAAAYSIYHRPRMSLLPFLSDKYLSLLAPIAIYWMSSLWFHALDTLQIPFFEKYRLHEPEEIQARNRVSARRVVVMVLIQQAIQTFLGVLVLEDEETVRRQVFQDHEANMRQMGVHLANAVVQVVGLKHGARILSTLGPASVYWLYWWIIPVLQYVWAFLFLDTWQYFLHRAFHESRFLYKHFHSHHHRLYVPYAFGALYNHPIEGLLLDSAGGALAHAAAFMTVRQGVLLFTFSTLKTVADHGGYAFPVWLDPLHLIFPNTAEYHDVHHQMQGLRFNYSQPFFVHFDVLFGTRMSAEKFQKMRATNEKLKKGNKSTKADNVHPQGEASDVANSTTSALNQEDDKMRRRRRGQEDVPAEEIAREEALPRDITVTRDEESYRAKAGIQTAS